ncbi:MAG: ABC transporter ATP-binding protein, partial [Clostridia bacterium]|nr:ABC transporter ATP-binding protein [Clostridia bacterium]
MSESKEPRKPQGRPGGPGARMIEKPKEFKKAGKRLLTYFKPYRFVFVLMFILAIFSVLFNSLAPVVLARITDSLFASFTAQTGVNFEYVFKMLIVLGGMYALSSVFRYFFQRRMASISQEIAYTMRRQMDLKMSRLPIKYFDSQTHGQILSRFVNDVDTVAASLSQTLNQVITGFVTLIGILAVMFYVSPILTIVTLLTVPLSLASTIVIAKKSQKYFKAQQNELGELNSHTEEMIGGQLIVKAFNYEEKSKAEFKELNDRLTKSSLLAQFVSGLIMPAIRFVSNLGYAAIALVGGYFAIKGQITVGSIQAFVLYSKQFNQPIEQTAQMAGILQSTVAAAERVFELLDADEMEENGHEKIHSHKGEVCFNNISFCYNENEPL